VSEPPTLDEVLAEARSTLDRVAAEHLEGEIAAGAIVVDVRDSALRDRQGPIPGAYVIDLTLLEWRLAPSSEARSIEAVPGQRVIIVCHHGYSSSLAAARLQHLGVSGATDLIGGFAAWSALRVSGVDEEPV